MEGIPAVLKAQCAPGALWRMLRLLVRAICHCKLPPSTFPLGMSGPGSRPGCPRDPRGSLTWKKLSSELSPTPRSQPVLGGFQLRPGHLCPAPRKIHPQVTAGALPTGSSRWVQGEGVEGEWKTPKSQGLPCSSELGAPVPQQDPSSVPCIRAQAQVSWRRSRGCQ